MRFKPVLLAAMVALVGVLFTNAQASLIDRGNGLIYDTVLDVTWLQDAGLGGQRTFAGALAWADSLVFGGFDDWRVPTISRASGLPVGLALEDDVVYCQRLNGTTGALEVATEVDCRDNEFGYMYYFNLGGNFGDDLTRNRGLIRNIQGDHWSAVDYSRRDGFGWAFEFSDGDQGPDYELSLAAAWAVRDGDVLRVPEPATLGLLGLGLLGAGVATRRQKGAAFHPLPAPGQQ